MSRRTVVAAGGVLWRGDPASPDVALVHRPRYDDWSLPKGKTKRGEHLLVTAAREVNEETGFDPLLGPRITSVHYRVTSHGRPADKVVTYWSMRCAGGAFQANREVDEMSWVPLAEAERRLSSNTDGVVLREFATLPRDTRPLLLLRHGATAARSGRLKSRPGARPLSRAGRDQADALVPVLEALGISDLLSADTAACVGTLTPFAAASGLRIHQDDRLTRAGFAGNETRVAELVRERASSGQALAVCGDQHVIRGLLGTLGRGSVGAPHEAAVSKGGWWLLHHRDGAVSAVERHWLAA
jgi:8-oxo-dGTP diphosphatase